MTVELAQKGFKSEDGLVSISFAIDNEYLVIVVIAPEISVRKKIFLYTDGESLANFLADLGDTSSKLLKHTYWASIENDLQLVADKRVNGTANVTITVSSQIPQEWSLKIKSTFDSSELLKGAKSLHDSLQ